MKRRTICLLLTLILLLACVTPAYAAFTDTTGHWAEPYILRACALGLFSGVSSTEFAPDTAMNRAMVVTVLAKLARINDADWSTHKTFLKYKFSDIKTGGYYANALSWALLRGVVGGTSATTYAPSAKITREQLATMIYSFLRKEGYKLRSAGAVPTFSDRNEISSWALEGVNYLAGAGVISGISDGKGGVKFAPQKNATRAECATMFCHVVDMMQRDFVPSYASAVTLTQTKLTLEAGKSQTLSASIFPASATNQTLVWASSNNSVVKVSNSGKLTAVAAGSATVYVMSNHQSASCEVTVTPGAATGLASANMSYSEKCMFVFGKTLSGGENSGVWRTVYATQAEAQANQVQVTVQVWVLSGSRKVSQTMAFSVHKNLAATVKQIFKEIYESADQPPVSAIGGWRWRSYETSEHNMGTALDLSPSSNPYVYAGSDPYSAGYRPGTDPYSIPIGGTIDQIFAKYGFKRGIYWNSGNRDYMHYSFFGW